MLLVITGGTKGIGKATIEKFASQGFDIATCARNEKDLQNLKSDIEKKHDVTVHTRVADLSSKTDCRVFVEFVRDLDEVISVLINNTGTFIPGSICDEEEGSLETMIDTNLYSAYYITRGLIGEMLEVKAGHIFNICSIASITAYANGGSYAISKHAMHGFSKCLREEMKPHGIRVTSILPGATLTASWEGVDLPPERFIKSSDVAEVIWNNYSLSAHAVVEEVVIRPQLGDI